MCLRSFQQAIYSPEQVGTSPVVRALCALHIADPTLSRSLTHRVIKGVLRGTRYVPDIDDSGVAALPARERELAVWEKLGLLLSACERRADDASRDVEAWLKCWFVKERVGEVFSGRVTGVASFGIFITLDTLFVEGMVHVSELGSDYFQYNEAMNELRGERTGMRYRLTDAVQVQVSRVDLEARRIEFRLVKGTGFKRSKQRLTRIRPTSRSARSSEQRQPNGGAQRHRPPAQGGSQTQRQG